MGSHGRQYSYFGRELVISNGYYLYIFYLSTLIFMGMDASYEFLF